MLAHPDSLFHSDQMAAGLCCKSTRGVKSEATEPRIPAKHRDVGKEASIRPLSFNDLNVTRLPPSGHMRDTSN